MIFTTKGINLCYFNVEFSNKNVFITELCSNFDNINTKNGKNVILD